MPSAARSLRRLLVGILMSTTLLTSASCERLRHATGMDPVPRALVERQITLSHPMAAGARIENLQTDILDAGDPRAGITNPVTPADQANGVEARYLVRWRGIVRDERGVASNVSGAEEIGKLVSGLWFSAYGIFDGEGRPQFTTRVSGRYRGTYDARSGHLDCTMTLGSAPEYAGTYACSGWQLRYTDEPKVPVRFTGTIRCSLFLIQTARR